MKQLLITLLLTIAGTSYAFQTITFKVCYNNWSKHPISYNNKGITSRWDNPGELVGTGVVAPGDSKCFNQITDNANLYQWPFPDYITFYLNNKWYGIVNHVFMTPFVVAADATNTKGAQLSAQNSSKTEYILYVHVKNNQTVILSNSSNLNEESQYITPRKLPNSN